MLEYHEKTVYHAIYQVLEALLELPLYLSSRPTARLLFQPKYSRFPTTSSSLT